MRVYHYLNCKFGLQSIRHRRLRISLVHLLKDPFEHRAIQLPADLEPAFDDMVPKLADPAHYPPHGSGIICMSETCDSPVMWSMYADNHEGICLGFDVPELHLYPVVYTKERVQFDTLDQNTMRISLTYKFDDWQYERERRILIGLPAEARGGHYFAEYDDNIALREVIVGYRSDTKRTEVLAAMGDHANGVEVFKVCRSLTDFAMIRDERGNW